MTNRGGVFHETLSQNSKIWNCCVGYSRVDTGTRVTSVESKLPIIDDLGGMSFAFSEPQFFHLYGGGYNISMKVRKVIAKCTRVWVSPAFE